MAKFIELNRLFAELDPKSIGERDDGTHSMPSLFYAPKSWNDVLSNRCTVIISEAGTGKTEELKNRAKVLLTEGKAAFFCRLDLLTTSSFEECLDPDSKGVFEAWRASDAPGFFFLDSVDEARLASPKEFEVALLRFVAAVGPYASRATTIISSRAAAWQAIADPAMLTTRLGVEFPEPAAPEQSDQSEDDNDEEHDVGDSVSKSNTVASPQSSSPKLSIVQMAPLNEDQVRIFAKARGIEDVDQFMDAIERADADLFAGRPSDLQGLVQIWKDQSRIGHYREVVKSNIDTKLREENPSHQAKCIDDKKAHEGAQRLAAAVTLTRKNSIRLPQTPTEPALDRVSLDAMEVLSDWKPEEVKDLLGRALFDESLYGTVRFHHRTAREYLTAKWLARLLDRRKGRRAVQSLLFGRPYGSLPEAAVPSMKPIIGWLALDDQQTRDKAIAIDPKILLEFGDASSLDIETRGLLLRMFATSYRHRQHTPLSLHVREIRRLGDQQLSATLSGMLIEFKNHHDVRQLLLRIVREGRIEGCGEAAIPLALSSEIDAYTQSCAVQAIGVTGSFDQREAIKTALLAGPDRFERQVLAAAVETLPNLTCRDVARIAELSRGAKPFSSDHLDSELEKYARRLSLSDKRFLLALLVDLLQRIPLKDENYCRVSVRYAWLLPLAFDLARQILTEDPDARDLSIIQAMSMAEQSDHLEGHSSDVRKGFYSLLEASRDLKHAFFWSEVHAKRQRSGEPVTDFWHPGIDIYAKEDFPFFITDLQSRTDDDKLVALSALITIYAREGKSQDLLDQVKLVVASDEVLKAALQTYLSPPPASSAVVAAEREHKRFEKRSELQKKKHVEDRKRWIAQLEADPTRVGDLSIAAEGLVWNNTRWLLDEIRRTKKSNSRWTVTDWQILENEFGRSVAKAFRDYCVGFWRLHEPKLHSEGPQNPNQTPLAVIIGLSGLAMEFRSDPALPSKLSDDEVKRATRYALEELNQMPVWLWKLFKARPKPITNVLVAEIKWELSNAHVEGTSNYILARLRWSATALGAALKPDLVGLILTTPDVHFDALVEALIVVLRDPNAVPMELTTHARAQYLSSSTEELKSLWLAFLICVSADFALPELESWIGLASTSEMKEARMTTILNNIWGGRFNGFNSPHNSYQRPDVLLRMLKLSHAHVRLQDDLVHEGVHSPGSRDHAEQARGHLFELLYKIPGRSTYDALVELSSFHTLQYPKDRTLALAEERASLDLEQDAWKSDEIEVFAAQAERAPKTQKQLFDLASSRLDDLKLELEEGDESEASLLRKTEDEYELRRAIANRLRNAARQFYDVASEEEFADRTRSDIRVHNPDVKERIPIEVKIAGKWRADKLRERLEHQLADQYMREAKHGVFLVVNRGADGDAKTWSTGGEPMGFPELINWLQDEARSIVIANATVEAIDVIGIDLTLRDVAAVEAAKERAKASASTTKPRKKARSHKPQPPGKK